MSKEAAGRIIGLYEENAAAWDRQRGRGLFEKPWLDRFLTLVAAKGTIVDLGCGMGEPVAAYFLSKGFRVVGIDSSPSLVALARARFPSQQWLAGDMRGLDLGRRFDGLIAWHSLFHLTPEAQSTMFPRFAAHLRPGAPLMFTSGPSLGETIGEWQGEPLYHGSLSPEDYEALLTGNGFETVDRTIRDAECGEATVWLAQRRPASGLDGSA